MRLDHIEVDTLPRIKLIKEKISQGTSFVYGSISKRA